MSNPVSCPGAEPMTWVPAPRLSPLASGPQSETARASRPSARPAVDPDTLTQSGAPSTVRRSPRHEDGMVAGGGGAETPGIPILAMPMGMVDGGL